MSVVLLHFRWLKEGRLGDTAQVDSAAIRRGIAASESRPDQAGDSKSGFRWSLTALCFVSYCFRCGIL